MTLQKLKEGEENSRREAKARGHHCGWFDSKAISLDTSGANQGLSQLILRL